MIKITKEYRFEAAHRLENHDGRCRRLHGHSYRVEVEFSGQVIERGPKMGMVIDYADISQIMEPIIEQLDHRFLVGNDNLDTDLELALPHDQKAFLKVATSTAENIATVIATKMILAKRGLPVGVVLSRVTVWETATSSATWQSRLTNPDA